jgi:hypothetical protein
MPGTLDPYQMEAALIVALGASCQFTKHDRDPVQGVGLWEKDRTLFVIAISNCVIPRGRDDLDGRPAISNICSAFVDAEAI